nr:hypothetical protein [Tanacetum cinerariifolium]
MMTDKDSSAAGSKPITPFIRTRPAKSKIQATLLGLNNTFPFVKKIIKEYTGQRPIHIQEACFEHNKKCFEDRVIPFFDMFKIHVMHCERNVAKNKCLQIQKKNLLIHDESLIADCIAKDVCSIVLASEREVLPRSNCQCKELQFTYDREHSREKDDTIRHLHAEKDILGLLNVGSTESRFETKALETEITQLKEETIVIVELAQELTLRESSTGSRIGSRLRVALVLGLTHGVSSEGLTMGSVDVLEPKMSCRLNRLPVGFHIGFAFGNMFTGTVRFLMLNWWFLYGS